MLLVASVLPYTRATDRTCQYARDNGVPVVAVTDSEVAPLAQIAETIIVVRPKVLPSCTPWSPAFAVPKCSARLSQAGERRSHSSRL